MSGNLSSFLPVIGQASQAYGVPAPLLAAQLQQESSFNPLAYNPLSGATGIAQFLPSTASSLGIDPTDPVQSIFGAAQYDAQLYQKSGSWLSALQSYGTIPSAGPLTPGQQQVAAIAQAADQGGLGGFFNPDMALGGANTGAGSGGNSSFPWWPDLGGIGSSIGSALNAPSNIASAIGSYAERGLAILLGLVLIGGGIYLLAPKVRLK